MTLHLIGIFHTQHTAAYGHCAFTGKALRFLPQEFIDALSFS
jgi:hypothetical protein